MGTFSIFIHRTFMPHEIGNENLNYFKIEIYHIVIIVIRLSIIGSGSIS